MSPNELTSDLRKQPFEPFRMYITDGTTHDIRHPDQCLVLTTSVLVGLKREPDELPYEKYVKIDCRHIVKTATLPPSAAGNNGQS